MFNSRLLLLAPLAAAALVSTPASADPISGTYTTGGATTGTGPWTLTSTNSTYSILRLVLDNAVDFGALTSLSVDYVNNLGGIGGGTPRLVFVTDSNHDGIEDGSFLLHFGQAGSFSDATAGPGNTGNLLALSDLGRYDLGGIGGSHYTDRATALSLASGYSVLRTSLIVDSYGGNDRSFTINGISLDGATGAVPEPATWMMLLLGFGAIGFGLRNRKARQTVAVSYA